jgi:hypothetical protein
LAAGSSISSNGANRTDGSRAWIVVERPEMAAELGVDARVRESRKGLHEQLTIDDLALQM